jgi:hypothetical protein
MQVTLHEWFKVAKPGMPFLVKTNSKEFVLTKINDKQIAKSSYDNFDNCIIDNSFSISNIPIVILTIVDRFDKSFTNLPVTLQGGVINPVNKKCTCDFRGSACWNGCTCGAVKPYIQP